MAVTSLLELLAIKEEQSQKATAITTALTQIEQAIAGRLAIDCTAGGTITLPFDDSSDISGRDALRCITIELNGNPSANFNVVHPDNQHLFFIKNNTNYTANVKTQDGSSLDIPTGQVLLVFCDGEEMVDILADFVPRTITVSNDFTLAYYGRIYPNQVLARAYANRKTTFDNDFGSCFARVGQGTLDSSPSSDIYLDIIVDGVKRGDVRIGDDSAAVHGNYSGQLTFYAGDKIELVAPAVVNDKIRDVYVSLPGKTVLTR